MKCKVLILVFLLSLIACSAEIVVQKPKEEVKEGQSIKIQIDSSAATQAYILIEAIPGIDRYQLELSREGNDKPLSVDITPSQDYSAEVGKIKKIVKGLKSETTYTVTLKVASGTSDYVTATIEGDSTFTTASNAESVPEG